MNVRKPTDYSAMFAALDELMAANLPQMELYRGIGCVVSDRSEKGAAVAAAEYLQRACPDAAGFSPRGLRRMRDFYRTYESVPEVMAEAMTIGWTQNVVIMEADLSLQEKTWYIRAVQQYGWSKLELAKQIAASAHLEISLDLPKEICYTGENNSTECVNDDEDSLHLQRQHLLKPDGRVCAEGSGEKGLAGEPASHRVRRHQHRGAWQPGLSLGKTQVGVAWHRLRRENSTTTHQLRLRQVRPPDRDGPSLPAEYAPHLRWRLRRQDALAHGLYRPLRRCCRPMVYG